MGSFIRFIIFSVVVGVLAVILVNYTSSELSPQAIEYNSKLSAVKENKNYIKANTLFKTLSLPVQTDNISTFVFQKYTLALDRKLLQILKANSKIIKSMDEIVFLGAIQDPIVEIGVETRVQSISERLRTRKLENSVFDLYLAYLRRFLARGANKAAVLAKLIRYEDFLTRSLYKLGHHEKKLSMLQSLRSVRKIIYSMDEKKRV